LTEAQEQQTRVATILNTAAQFGNELTMQMLCDAMDMDYEEIKGKIPDPEEETADPFKAQSALDAVVTDEPDGGGVIE
jgi:hypothetical protein